MQGGKHKLISIEFLSLDALILDPNLKSIVY